MIATLEYLKTELRLDISTLCSHLRAKAYPIGSDTHQNALNNLFYFELLADELSRILSHHRNTIEAMEHYLIGEEFNLFEKENGETIHRYCLRFFERVECPLGSATDDLKRWVSTHADRKKQLREGFDQYFPNLNFLTLEKDETGEEKLEPVSDAELFESKTQGFLRDIETSNALDEFSQAMSQAHELLKAEAPIVDILVIVKGKE